jgi:hypothetical protein
MAITTSNSTSVNPGRTVVAQGWCIMADQIGEVWTEHRSAKHGCPNPRGRQNRHALGRSSDSLPSPTLTAFSRQSKPDDLRQIDPRSRQWHFARRSIDWQKKGVRHQTCEAPMFFLPAAHSGWSVPEFHRSSLFTNVARQRGRQEPRQISAA